MGSLNLDQAVAAGQTLQEYEQMKFELAEVIRTARMPLDKGRDQAADEQYQALLTKLAEDQFNLAVLGQFNRGKTSLMNAVLGMDRLPTGIVPLTSVITIVRYGSTERLVIRYERSLLNKEAPIRDLPHYVTQAGNPGNQQKIQTAEVQLPVEILRRGFYFVDTPGLGSAILANTATTKRFLPEIDAVVLVTSFDAPLSNDELRFLEEARWHSPHFFFVVNKADLVSTAEREQILGFITSALEQAGFPKAKVFALSARDGLKAKLSGDEKLLQRSGLPEFERELIEFLTRDKSRAFLARAAERLLALLVAKGPERETAALIARIDELRQKALGHAADARGARTALPEYADKYVRTTEICAVCQAVLQRLFDFLSRYQYQISTDRDQQMFHASAGGFCPLHTWQYERIASPRGVSTAYPPLLRSLADRLRGIANADSPAEMATVLAAAVGNSQECEACRMNSAAEEETIARLLARDKGATAALPMLCIPHLRAMLRHAKDVGLARELVLREAALCERLSENMQRFALKQDALRRTLLSDDERLAYERALMLLAGHRNVSSPELQAM